MNNSQINYLPIMGTELAYLEAGQGLSLVFIHAGIANIQMWDQQAPLAAHYHLVRYDMRGYGLSRPTGGKYAHYEDLLGLMDALELEQAVLVGCSKGGGVAIDAALSASDRVMGLVLVSSAPHGLQLDEPTAPPPQWEQAVEAFKAGDLDGANELEMQIWMDGYLQPVGRAPHDLREKVRKMNQIALDNEKNGPEAAELVLEPKAATRMTDLKIPTAIILGELDDPDIHQAAKIMADEVPVTRINSIPDTAHLPNMERPSQFNQLVNEFIDEEISR
ncbi:MAG: alpha/beta hydrolase [Anaerolineales bacterium]|jgi:pimeloyl-ACP methyl ester carboxylesterase